MEEGQHQNASMFGDDPEQQSHANVTPLREPQNTSENKEKAGVAAHSQDPVHAPASESNTNDERTPFDFSIEDAERYFLDNGYYVAGRTISFYCQHSKFLCKKFSSKGVRRWFIQKQSLDSHITQMRRDGQPLASNRMHSPENKKTAKTKDSANTQELEQQSHATATDEYKDKYIAHLEVENDFLRDQLTVNEKHVTALEDIAKGLGGLLSEPKNQRNQDGGGDNSPEENLEEGVQ